MTMDSFSVWAEYRRVRFGSFQPSRKSEGRSLLARDEMDFRRWLARSSRGEIVLLARKSFLSSSDFFVLESSPLPPQNITLCGPEIQNLRLKTFGRLKE
ncbi:unnamed protein product [Nezara viridula]|uniref:Uncharacterized protein n=1 Tax=Nezara viridula TaxID=85310 RepID=A0A9P0MU67_NEZVI|nr:unnamed protein product [Nezara viridula]